MARANRFSRRPVCASRPSADLAGRAVALSLDVPAAFDAPLAPHHREIGRWAALRDPSAVYTRHEARARIEQAFGEAVLEILNPFTLADLRVVVLVGDDDLPPAIAVICDSVGQLDLGWIEADENVLSQTLTRRVAPMRWRAAAYKALGETLNAALPVIGWDDLFEELSGYHWDGATDDESARRCQIEWQGVEPDEVDENMLPSAIIARRPEWMLGANAAPLKDMPQALSDAIRALRRAHKALKADGAAWNYESELVHAYVPGHEKSSHLPSMTIVPVDVFGREVDDIAHHGMQEGFSDIIGLHQLSSSDSIDTWFASLEAGATFLTAAQDLINLDPANQQ